MNYVRLKKLAAALLVGAFAVSIPAGISEAKRLHDPKVETKTLETRHEKISKSPEVEENLTSEKNFASDVSNVILDILPEIDFFVPKTVSSSDSSIIGTPLATQKQCVKYLMRNNPNPNLNVSAEEIVAYYYEEGMREGIRPDVAICQAIKETGFWNYGGDVDPKQNNFCGLGTTGGGVRGGYFPTAQLGVRAHIQHLLAYTSTRRPITPLVDPRYDIVRKAYGTRTLSNWSDLNGRWAVPGHYYGQEIMSMFIAMVSIRPQYHYRSNSLSIQRSNPLSI